MTDKGRERMKEEIRKDWEANIKPVFAEFLEWFDSRMSKLERRIRNLEESINEEVYRREGTD